MSAKTLLAAFLPFLVFIISSCHSSSVVSKRYTNDDKNVFSLIDRLKKNPNDAEAAALLPDAYKQAAEVRKALNKNTFENMSEGDRWIEISRQLLVAQQLYTEIKGNATLSKIIPNPWDPTLKIQEAKTKAAEEYYNQGTTFLNYDNRPYAKKAYDMFVKANSAYPNYKDVREKMAEALMLATIKVVVQPVNYHNYGWSYWGFQNDFLQYKMVRDLNNSSYRDVRFYTDADAAAQRIQVDRVVELNFNDLYIGQAFNDNYSIKRTAQIKTGETKSNPPQPIYTNVNATVTVSRKLLQSNASLECRIYDVPTGRNILFDHFPGNYAWKIEKATYRGDSRALTDDDWKLINNKDNDYPPDRKDIAERLINDCYGLLLNRIKSGVNFD